MKPTQIHVIELHNYINIWKLQTNISKLHQSSTFFLIIMKRKYSLTKANVINNNTTEQQPWQSCIKSLNDTKQYFIRAINSSLDNISEPTEYFSGWEIYESKLFNLSSVSVSKSYLTMIISITQHKLVWKNLYKKLWS